MDAQAKVENTSANFMIYNVGTDVSAPKKSKKGSQDKVERWRGNFVESIVTTNVSTP